MNNKLNLIFILLLVGCSSTPATDSLINNAQSNINNASNSLNSISNNLSKECKTDVVLANINTLRNQIISAKSDLINIGKTCTAEVNVQEQKTTKWIWAFFSLLLVSISLGFILFKIK